MNTTHRFDALTRTLANRLTRRSAVTTGAAALAGLGLHQTSAQEATPVSATPVGSDEGDHLFFMFVQVAQSGGITPKPGEDGVYQVTLDGAFAQTVYFSDRPDRIVGSVAMDQFIEGLGFSPENPPNAAIVTQTDQGEDVLVVELLNPVWDESGGTLTYDVRVLDDYQGQGLADLAAQQSDDTLPETLGETSLFIDDCMTITSCYNGVRYLGPIPGQPYPACFDPSRLACEPCSGDMTRRDLAGLCREEYSDCGALCNVK